MGSPTGFLIPASNVPTKLAEFRNRNIHHPGVAVPLHTSLSGGFLDYEEITSEVTETIREVAARCAPFAYHATSVCCFPTTRVLWLAPTPQGGFETVTEALYRSFPKLRKDAGFPTYHMTVAYLYDEGQDAHVAGQFNAECGDLLPLEQTAEELCLYGQIGGRWQCVFSAPLGS